MLVCALKRAARVSTGGLLTHLASVREQGIKQAEKFYHYTQKHGYGKDQVAAPLFHGTSRCSTRLLNLCVCVCV